MEAIAAHGTSILQYMKDYDLEYRILEEPLITVGIGVAFSQNDARGLDEELSQTSQAILGTLTMPEKSYTARIPCEDGSYTDIAAVQKADSSQIIVVYYHTPVEYIDSFSASLKVLLAEYSLERDGTIVVSSGAPSLLQIMKN